MSMSEQAAQGASGTRNPAAGASERSSNWRSISIAYLGLCTWLLFLDGPWTGLEGVGGGAFFLVLLATCGCGGLFFHGLAQRGLERGEGRETIASAAFGPACAAWLVERGQAAAFLIVQAIGLVLAVETCLIALVVWGWIRPEQVEPITLGGILLRPPLVIATCAFWLFITGMAETLGLAGVVAALMRVYSPSAFVLVLLTTALAVFWGQAGMRAVPEATRYSLAAVPILGSLFALAALFAADWGTRLKRREDAALAAVVGIPLPAFAMAGCGWLVAILGAARGYENLSIARVSISPAPATFRAGVLACLPPAVAGGVLLLLALAAVAPVYFAGHAFAVGWRASRIEPRKSRLPWIGAGIVLLLAAVPLPINTTEICASLGAMFAAMIAVMIAAPGGVPRPRAIEPAGMIAWAVGASIGIGLEGLDAVQPALGNWVQPAALHAFWTAFLAHRLLAAATGLQRTKHRAP